MKVNTDLQTFIGVSGGTVTGGSFHALADCLVGPILCADGGKPLGISPDSIFVTEYPDLTHRAGAPDFDAACTYLGISQKEMQWAYDSVLQTLDARLQLGADAEGFRFVSGIRTASVAHGICVDVGRWFNQIDEAILIQGVVGTTPKGAFHPNPAGHRLAYEPAIETAFASVGIGGSP